MQLNITARHLDLTPALSDYVHRKIEKARRYLDSIVWAQTVLTVEKHRHIAEVVVHAPGNTFRTKGESGDLYSAIDIAAHKLDLHLARVKDKQRQHRKKNHVKSFNLAATGGDTLTAADARALSSVKINSIKNQTEIGFSSLNALAGDAPNALIQETNQISLESRSLNQAMKELNSNSLQFLLFINDRTNRINVLYKKAKDAYGLLDVES